MGFPADRCDPRPVRAEPGQLARPPPILRHDTRGCKSVVVSYVSSPARAKAPARAAGIPQREQVVVQRARRTVIFSAFALGWLILPIFAFGLDGTL
jgi:hypothetical protein